MRTLIPLLIVLACPLMMIFMMRGMHGSHGNDDQPTPHDQQPRSRPDVARDERIAELEREVAALRDQDRHRDTTAGRR